MSEASSMDCRVGRPEPARTCQQGCNGCDECTDYDDLTEEDRNREYLRQRPALEMNMWMDWVQTVCRHRKIAPPTGLEWDSLTATFHHGKMPITSVDELEAMRMQPNTK